MRQSIRNPCGGKPVRLLNRIRSALGDSPVLDTSSSIGQAREGCRRIASTSSFKLPGVGTPDLLSAESTTANNIFSQMRGSSGHNTTWRLNASMYAKFRFFKDFSAANFG